MGVCGGGGLRAGKLLKKCFTLFFVHLLHNDVRLSHRNSWLQTDNGVSENIDVSECVHGTYAVFNRGFHHRPDGCGYATG